MDLDTHTTVYGYIQALLAASVKSEPSYIRVTRMLEVVQSAVHAACSDFAQKWNTDRAGSLPAEILSECFRRLPYPDRVSVSCVSRNWRVAALADRFLWRSFSCTGPDKDIEDQRTRKLVAQLSVMLERSRPDPITLTFPKSNRGFRRLEDCILQVAGPDFARTQLFEGSFEIYHRLNPDGAAMPHLQCLKLLTKPGPIHSIFHLPLTWGSTGAPLLRQLDLDGPILYIPPGCPPISALTRISFYSSCNTEQVTFSSLFECCPNLVTLDIHGVTNETRLPPGPLLPTLEHVALYAADDHRVDFGQPLEPWLDFPVRRLELHGSRTLGHPLAYFLYCCADPIGVQMLRATTYVRQLVPEDQAPCRYSARPYSWHNNNDLWVLRTHAPAARITSLTVHAMHLGEVFRAQLTLPLLHTFEFQLDCRESAPFPDALPEPSFTLAAPGLRHVGVHIPDVLQEAAAENRCTRAFGVLRVHMRDLIQYDAALLDTVTVDGPRRILAAMSCADLASLAAAYVERTDQQAWRAGQSHVAASMGPTS